MNPWTLIGATTIFLIVAVIIAVVFVVIKGTRGEAQQVQGPSMLAGVMLIVSIVIIIAAFVAYFNGVFNKYKTTPEDLKLKYDYLAYYQPVGLIQGATPATYSESSKLAFDSISTEFKSLYMTAASALIKNKTRVETALSNVRLIHDPKVLSNYDFTIPCLKLADFMKKNDSVIQANSELTVRLMIDSLASLGVNSSFYFFDIYDGNKKVDRIHITVIVGIYLQYYDKYPTIVASCIKNGICPFTQ